MQQLEPRNFLTLLKTSFDKRIENSNQAMLRRNAPGMIVFRK